MDIRGEGEDQQKKGKVQATRNTEEKIAPIMEGSGLENVQTTNRFNVNHRLVTRREGLGCPIAR